MEFFQSSEFWIGLLKIIWINIILSGDNAVVIALAARSLPEEQQRKAIMFGSGAAVVLRVALTVVAAKLLEVSYLQIVGGLLLLWIGSQLLSEDNEDEGGEPTQSTMGAAIRTILIADLVKLRQRDWRGSRCQGQHGFAHFGFGHQYSFGCFWQLHDDQTHDTLPNRGDLWRVFNRLGGRRNHRQRCGLA